MQRKDQPLGRFPEEYMVTLAPDAPITRREFHMEFMLVWLFVVLGSAAALDNRARWTSILVPLFALFMVFLHGRALRRASSPVTPGTRPEGSAR